jgi:hypothetical protein
MKHPLFLLFGLSLIGGASMAEYFGWGFGGDRAKIGNPRTIRDNPGAYRSIYRGYNRYFGGK